MSYRLHKVITVFGVGEDFENGADAVEEAMIFCHNNYDGVALLYRVECPDALWTMFKWSEVVGDVVPVSVTVQLPLQLAGNQQVSAN